MPQPVSYNPGTPVSGSIQENNISYVVDGQQRNYRGGFGGLSWMSEAPAENNVIFIGNSVSLGRGPANIPLFYPAYNTSQANIVYAANTLPGSPRNFTTSASAYNWAVTNNFFINNSDNPIPRIDADGLVLYLDANQPTSYPQTGTSWYDLSGKNNNGTLTNGPTWNSNGWFQFDGVDDYVNCGNPSISAGKITVSALVNLNTFSNPGGSSHIVDSNSNSWHLAVLTNGVPYFWNGTTYHTAGTPLSTSRWYMLTGVQGTTLDIYVNGELNNSLNSNVNVTTDNIWIGAWALANRFLNGQVSNTQIYPRALSQAEIKQNYFQSNIVQDGLVFMTDANNLVSYPKSGTTLYNLTGSQTGTLINGVGYSSNNGGYWTFDGVDDYIAVSSPQSLNPGTNSFSIEFWCFISPSLPDSGASCALEARSTSNLYGFLSIAYYPGGYMSLFVNGADDPGQNVYTSTTNPVQKNTWIHQTMVVDRTTQQITFYYNGVQTGNKVNLTDTGTLDPGSGYTYYIGGDLGGSEMNGNIASLRQYNKALSPSEIQQNYQATKDKFQGQQIITNGLVLNLDSANKDSYPGTGTTWTDLTGVAGNATLYNGVGFDYNLWGGSLSFDSVDDYSRITNPNVTLGTNPRTLIGWFRATSSVYGCIFGFGNSPFGTPTYGSMELWNYADPLSMHYAGGSISSGLSLSANLNKWLMAVLKFDGTTAFIQIIDNGTSYSNSSNVPLNTYTANFSINKSAYASEGGGLAGYWGMSLLYNRALSATEITQVYNATKGKFGL